MSSFVTTYLNKMTSVSVTSEYSSLYGNCVLNRQKTRVKMKGNNSPYLNSISPSTIFNFPPVSFLSIQVVRSKPEYVTQLAQF